MCKSHVSYLSILKEFNSYRQKMLGDDFWSHLEERTHVNLSLSFYPTAFDGLKHFWKAPIPKKGSIFCWLRILAKGLFTLSVMCYRNM